VIEDLVVGVLSKALPELGEEAVTRRMFSEAACPGDSLVVFEAYGQPSVSGHPKLMLQQLRLEHG